MIANQIAEKSVSILKKCLTFYRILCNIKENPPKGDT